MRTGTWIALLMLALVVACGVISMNVTADVSRTYTNAAEELMLLTQKQDWQRVADEAEAYRQSWEGKLDWLHMLVNHGDIDAVTEALRAVQAGAAAQDLPTALMGCHQLSEAAEHIYHRDAFTLGNIL